MATLLEHKTARRDFEFIEEFEVGIELLGQEVKSLRGGQGTLTGSHVIVRGGEVYIVGMQIPAYQAKNAGNDYDPIRTRRLLLTKAEIQSLANYGSKKGYTLIPISVYTKDRKIKLRLAVARGKKKFDKRADIKKREDVRYAARAIKERLNS
ncbi:MAG TPA: SsrA-binding protein SmpB [Candidatus Paceibacterota bacterium]